MELIEQPTNEGEAKRWIVHFAAGELFEASPEHSMVLSHPEPNRYHLKATLVTKEYPMAVWAGLSFEATESDLMEKLLPAARHQIEQFERLEASKRLANGKTLTSD